MKKLFSSYAPWAAVLAASLALTGCLTDSSTATNPALDGGNVVFAQEVGNMALVLNGSGTLAKAASHDSVEDSANREKILSPLQFDTSCQCFVRSADFTNSNKDFARTRADSIWLYKGGQAIVDSFVPRQADSIIHIRHVTRINGQSGRSLDFTARTTLVKRVTDSGTVYAWSGTITGTLDGTTLTGTTFSLVRTFTAGAGFGNPEGSLFLKRGLRDVLFDIHGDGTATCTIRRGDKVERTTHIDKNDNES